MERRKRVAQKRRKSLSDYLAGGYTTAVYGIKERELVEHIICVMAIAGYGEGFHFIDGVYANLH